MCTQLCVFHSWSCLMHGDEQRVTEGLAFTQAHIYLLYQWYCHCHWPLGTLQDWVEIMTLARSHQWSALNTFLLDKPVLKKVFTTLALVSPRLYRVYFQHGYTSGFPSSLWGLCHSQGTVYESTSLGDFWPRPMGWVSLEAGGLIGSTTSLGKTYLREHMQTLIQLASPRLYHTLWGEHIEPSERVKKGEHNVEENSV